MFKSDIPCKGEGCNSIYIQNKKYHLCSNCVFKMNHGGKNQQEVYSERSRVKLKERIEESASVIISNFGKPKIKLISGLSEEEQNVINQNKAEEEAKKDLLIEEEGQKLFEQKILKQQQKKTQPPIRKSKKQIIIDSKLRLVYQDMDYTEEKVCSGCNRYQGGDIVLSHSHIISQKECKQIGREDLITDKVNLTYHCMDYGENTGCHRKWESPIERITLADYQKNIEFIKTVDEGLYLRYTKADSSLF